MATSSAHASGRRRPDAASFSSSAAKLTPGTYSMAMKSPPSLSRLSSNTSAILGCDKCAASRASSTSIVTNSSSLAYCGRMRLTATIL